MTRFYFSIPRATLMGVLLALSGCSHLPWQMLPTDAGIEQLSKEHRYVTALKVLDTRKRSAPNYAQKREEILADLKKYQTELLRQANELVQQQQFAKAEVLIETERPELPASRELTQFDAEFSAARDRYLQRNLDELVQLRAPGLAREHNAYLAVLKAAGTPELQRLVARHQADVDYFSPLIAKLGSQALALGDYEKAAQYLGIANQLQPSSTLALQLRTAEQALTAEKQKQLTARANIREQRYRELRNALQKSIRDHEFFAARDLLVQARTLNAHSDELDLLQREIDDATAAFVAQKIEAGNRAYSDGHLEEALQHWRPANALAPTAELQEKIDKAQKFIERLEQLRKPTR
ncbi:MAG: hypothetical protein QM709_04230 [Spongiibacteraceae bacterium]